MADCTFQSSPEDFLLGQIRAREAVYERARKLDPFLRAAGAANAVPASSIPRRNLIDEEIFGLLGQRGVPSAPLSSDDEFLRRIYLDLTGRIPAPDDIRAFLADSAPDKRDRVIDQLLASEAFIDKWTMWLGDLVENTASSSNVSRQQQGRNAFHSYLRAAVAEGKSLKDLAWELVVWGGNNYEPENGAANYVVGAITPMGPAQDTYDAMLAKTARNFLGISHYDCLLCHDGRGHLDQISLWGRTATRLEAQRMAAFFSRVRFTRQSNQSLPLYNSYTVTTAATGTYDLNTNYGNRPNRVAPVIQGRPLVNLTPEYRETRAAPASPNWRDEFAAQMVRDPMFARNLANRLWKQMFGLGLVEPVDALDPARLDPSNPPPPPWTFQATHPLLLAQLAEELGRLQYDLRGFLRLLAQSSAYQLSSRYDGEWKLDYVTLFARHYPRRLEGEEVHDAIVKATGIPGRYTVTGWSEPAVWAMQLPEPVEPRSNGAVAAFMNVFLRGNRDTQQRSQAGSILQRMYLLNDAFVTTRVKRAASPTLQAVSRMQDNGAAVDELFLLFLSRMPTPYERERSLAFLANARTAAARDTALEDLAWALINKADFVFSY